MGLRFGKNELSTMVEALEADHDTVEDAAQAVLAAAEDVLERRARFAVVGQLCRTRSGVVSPSSPEAVKVCLGFYSTEGDARKAAESLWASTVTGDEYLVWVLPLFHGTAAELHAKQKQQYADAEAKAADAALERLKQTIEKRILDADARNKGGKGSCDTCGHQPYDHKTDGSSRGKCGLGDCSCARWHEKKK